MLSVGRPDEELAELLIGAKDGIVGRDEQALPVEGRGPGDVSGFGDVKGVALAGKFSFGAGIDEGGVALGAELVGGGEVLGTG